MSWVLKNKKRHSSVSVRCTFVLKLWGFFFLCLCLKSIFSYYHTVAYLPSLPLQIDASLTMEQLQMACSSPGTSTTPLSSVIFQRSMFDMVFSGAAVDVQFAASADHHFDDETFQGGRDLITAGSHQIYLLSKIYISIFMFKMFKWFKLTHIKQKIREICFGHFNLLSQYFFSYRDQTTTHKIVWTVEDMFQQICAALAQEVAA